MLDNLTGGRFDMGLGRGLRPPEFEAFGVDQEQSREMFLESFEIIRRVWADENFVHHGKYWTVQKDAPLSPPLVQHLHPPFLVSAQSEESLRWAAQHDIPFAQIDSIVEQAKRDQALYREVQTAHGHPPAARLYLTPVRGMCSAAMAPIIAALDFTTFGPHVERFGVQTGLVKHSGCARSMSPTPIPAPPARRGRICCSTGNSGRADPTPASGKAYPDLSGAFGVKHTGDPPHSCVEQGSIERLRISVNTADQRRERHVRNVLT